MVINSSTVRDCARFHTRDISGRLRSLAVCSAASRTTTSRLLIVRCARHESRPDPRDVIRLSKGQKARKRGTGSRNVAHRLNADEAKQFEVAQKRKFVVLMGDGFRRERRDSPLLNTWRQWADSHEWVCVQVRQGRGGDSKDTVVVDLSTLRGENDDMIRSVAKAASLEHGCQQVKEDNPLGFLDPEILESDEDSAESVAEEIERLNAAAESQGLAVRRIKESLSDQITDGGSVNQHPDVQEAVQVLKSLRREASALENNLIERATMISDAERSAEVEANCIGAIWEIRPVELHFEAPDRPTARSLAQEIVSTCCNDRPDLK